MFGIPKIVMGENESWLSRGEQTFKERGIEVINAGKHWPTKGGSSIVLTSIPSPDNANC